MKVRLPESVKMLIRNETVKGDKVLRPASMKDIQAMRERPPSDLADEALAEFISACLEALKEKEE